MAEIQCAFAFAIPSKGSGARGTTTRKEKKSSRFNQALSMIQDQVKGMTAENHHAKNNHLRNDSSNSFNSTENGMMLNHDCNILRGKLLMTTYRLQFYYDPPISQENKEVDKDDEMAFENVMRRFQSLSRVHEYCSVPLGAIARIEKDARLHCIKVKTKDNRKFDLLFDDKQERVLFKVINVYTLSCVAYSVVCRSMSYLSHMHFRKIFLLFLHFTIACQRPLQQQEQHQEYNQHHHHHLHHQQQQ